MAGYVAVSLLKKARKTSKNPALQIKRRLFVRVLQSMKAVQQPGEPDTLFEYSSHWCELIDRGGLYNISNNVFRLVQSIEMVVRQELNTQNYLPGNDLCAQISEQVLNDQQILRCWEDIIDGHIPLRYELYSIELLQKIVRLWVTIRGFSFAKTWTLQFESKNKKGTRKTLKPEA